MRRKDNFVYHRKVKEGKYVSKKVSSCPYGGKRLPKSIGIKCPICNLRLRTRMHSPSNESDIEYRRQYNKNLKSIFKKYLGVCICPNCGEKGYLIQGAIVNIKTRHETLVYRVSHRSTKNGKTVEGKVCTIHHSSLLKVIP